MVFIGWFSPILHKLTCQYTKYCPHSLACLEKNQHGKNCKHLTARKFLVIFGAEEADRRSPFNDDKPKRAKICRHKALRVMTSLAYFSFTVFASWLQFLYAALSNVLAANRRKAVHSLNLTVHEIGSSFLSSLHSLSVASNKITLRFCLVPLIFLLFCFRCRALGKKLSVHLFSLLWR